MFMQIVRERWSIRQKFDISIDGQPRMVAKRKFFTWFPKFTLYETGGEPILRTKCLFHAVRPRFEIRLRDGRTMRLAAESHNFHFVCRAGRDRYELFAHKGRRVSIFRNDRQIAYFERQKLTVLNKRVYDVYADDDANAEWLAAFILAWDSHHVDETGEAEIRVDLGFLGPEDRPFDESWTPRAAGERSGAAGSSGEGTGAARSAAF